MSMMLPKLYELELRHCSEVCGEDFTVTGLQSCDEEIHGLFGSRVDLV